MGRKAERGALAPPLALGGNSPPEDIFAEKKDGVAVQDLAGSAGRLIAEIDETTPVLIAGPTASGKSALAAGIVARRGGVVVNADALQVYDCWRVLSARPSAAEEAALPHRLYGHIGCDAPYSVGHWLREVREVLAEGLRPVIVGGTGLYFAALTEGLAEIPPTPAEVRALADQRMADDGAGALLAELDPETAARIDVQNPARVQRAWEVLQATGQGLAQWQDQTAPALLPLAQVVPIVLRPGVDWLNARIDQRFDQMIAQGALSEVDAALADWHPRRPSSRAIGAPELVAYLRGEIPLAQAIAEAKIATRQYAKRQRTWFRNRMKSWKPLDPGQ